MYHRRRFERGTDVLPEAAAARLLTRASELDAVREAGVALSELRAAATEAGISPASFEAALAELQHADPAPVPDVTEHPPGRPLKLILAAALAILIAASTVAVGRGVPAGASPPVVEQALVLRCLAADEAAELIRPLLQLPTNRVSASARTPRVLTISATPEQIRRVRALLDQYDRTGATACASQLPPTPPSR